jgi:hypothetical protein
VKLIPSSLVFLCALIASSSSSFGNADPAVGAFPSHPDSSLTPGSLCAESGTYRYPERIAYCRRDVSSGEKHEIIRNYDQQLGFQIGKLNRQLFKIDHLIPLCMGGSNEPDNLWPQHQSVYTQTDPMEQVACDKMAQGRLRQNEAVRLIRRGKSDFSQIPSILRELRAL